MSEPWARWQIKRAARRTVVLCSVASMYVPLRRLAVRPAIRVITYHRFADAPRDPWCVSPRAFEEQMRWLSSSGRAVSLEETMKLVCGESKLAADAVLVTMDDGFRSVYTVAAPILRRWRIPAVAFVTSSAIGGPGPSDNCAEPFMTWEEVSALGKFGVTVGSHGHTHRSMAALSAAEVFEEALRSKEMLESRLGREVTAFAYPFGMRRDENPLTARILADCGYRSVFVSQHGLVRPNADPLRLPRIKIEGGEPAWMFRLICAGGMDAWRLVDRVL